MSTKRRTSLPALVRGPNGFYLCRFCATECSGSKQRTYCSDACIHEWRLRSDPGYLREHVFKRDQGLCTKCRLDAEALMTFLRTQPYGFQVLFCERMGLGARGSAWDADHIRPVAKGGGECGLENLQTLCVWCHQKKTGSQASVRGAETKQAKQRKVPKPVYFRASENEQLRLPFT